MKDFFLIIGASYILYLILYRIIPFFIKYIEDKNSNKPVVMLILHFFSYLIYALLFISIVPGIMYMIENYFTNITVKRELKEYQQNDRYSYYNLYTEQCNNVKSLKEMIRRISANQ